MTKDGSSASLRSLLAVAALALLVAACRGDEPRIPFIVVGIDGAEWEIIEELWDIGQLPNLRALAERGVRTHLQTDYGKSPVIWTTIATGQPPSRHGITGFVVSTPDGEVPVSSKLRRVPAIWNILTRLQRPVAVLGWYASWPAEAIDGLMVTDHVMRRTLDSRVHPAKLQPEIDARIDEIRDREDDRLYPYRAAQVPRALGERDALLEELAPELAGQSYDLLLVYYRSVDEISHNYWKFWRSAGLKRRRGPRGIAPAELAQKREWIPASYGRVDAAIGRIVCAAPEANIMVLSDHGFRKADFLRITTDFDALLEHLGYLVRVDGEVDVARSQALATDGLDDGILKHILVATPQRVRGGKLSRSEGRLVIERLTADLDRVRYESGKPAFQLRRPADRSIDLVVTPRTPGASKRLLFEDQIFDDVVRKIEHISGGHRPNTHGIFIAAGPDVDPRADPSGISIHDITPTLLYALGLPVAEDFSGRPWQELFTPELRLSNPLRTISSYGVETEGEALASEADEEIIDELRALGYLD